MSNRFISYSVELNALDYLEKAGYYIVQAQSKEKEWKWVILSLHGALYGFAIAACKSTDLESVINTTNNGQQKLITLDQAIKKCQKKEWMGTLEGGLPLVLSREKKDSIRLLKNTLRNNFEHYIPRGWYIEIHGLPKMTIDILNIIRFLAVETYRYQNLNSTQRRKIKSIVYQSKKL